MKNSVVILALAATSLWADTNCQRRVAVLGTNTTAQSANVGEFGNVLGQSMTDSMEEALSRSGIFLVERGKLEAVLSEQNKVFSDRFREDTFSAVGQLVGANTMAYGVLQGVSTEDSRRCVEIWGKTVCKGDVRIEVSVVLHMVNLETGKKWTSLGVGREKLSGGFSLLGTGPIKLEDLFKRSRKLPTKAMKEAMDAATAGLLSQAANSPVTCSTPKPQSTPPTQVADSAATAPAIPAPKAEALTVANVNGNRVYIYRSGDIAVRAGDYLEVKRLGNKIYVPGTTDLIGYEKTSIELLRVVDVQDRLVEAVTLKNDSQARPADILVKASAPQPVVTAQTRPVSAPRQATPAQPVPKSTPAGR